MANREKLFNPYDKECFAIVQRDVDRWYKAETSEPCVYCGRAQRWIGPGEKSVCPTCWPWGEDVEAKVKPKSPRPFKPGEQTYIAGMCLPGAHSDPDDAVTKRSEPVKPKKSRRKKEPPLKKEVTDGWITFICSRCYSPITERSYVDPATQLSEKTGAGNAEHSIMPVTPPESTWRDKTVAHIAFDNRRLVYEVEEGGRLLCADCSYLKAAARARALRRRLYADWKPRAGQVLETWDEIKRISEQRGKERDAAYVKNAAAPGMHAVEVQVAAVFARNAAKCLEAAQPPEPEDSSLFG